MSKRNFPMAWKEWMRDAMFGENEMENCSITFFLITLQYRSAMVNFNITEVAMGWKGDKFSSRFGYVK